MCVCVFTPSQSSQRRTAIPILVMALLFRCPSWGGGSWGSPADRGRKRMTLSAHQRRWAGGAGCLGERGELCTCGTPASPVAPAHLGAPRARDERCQGVPPSRRGSHRAGWRSVHPASSWGWGWRGVWEASRGSGVRRSMRGAEEGAVWQMCPIKLLQTLPQQLLPAGPWVQIGSVSLPQGGVSGAIEQWPAQLAHSRPSPALPNLGPP